jgi:hypothetical protein
MVEGAKNDPWDGPLRAVFRYGSVSTKNELNANTVTLFNRNDWRHLCKRDFRRPN